MHKSELSHPVLFQQNLLIQEANETPANVTFQIKDSVFQLIFYEVYIGGKGKLQYTYLNTHFNYQFSPFKLKS